MIKKLIIIICKTAAVYFGVGSLCQGNNIIYYFYNIL